MWDMSIWHWTVGGLGGGRNIPGRRPMSQLSCFLEMLVQERSSMRGCRLMIPVSAWGVMVRLTLRSIRDHSRLSRHLTKTVTKQQTHGCKAIPPEDHHTEVSLSRQMGFYHLCQLLQTAIQTQRSARLR